MPGKALVVDANILIRAALGKRVRKVIETYAGQVSFFVPEVAYAEAEEHLPALAIAGAWNVRFVPLMPMRSTVP
jgi:predicted nucleic acid-binding protein